MTIRLMMVLWVKSKPLKKVKPNRACDAKELTQLTMKCNHNTPFSKDSDSLRLVLGGF